MQPAPRGRRIEQVVYTTAAVVALLVLLADSAACVSWPAGEGDAGAGRLLMIALTTSQLLPLVAFAALSMVSFSGKGAVTSLMVLLALGLLLPLMFFGAFMGWLGLAASH